MRILHVTNAYPSCNYNEHPSYGIFIKEQIDSLIKKGINCRIIYIDARTKGKLQYLRKVSDIKKQSKDCDLVHCHHTYSSFVTKFLARPEIPVITSFMSPRGTEGRDEKFIIVKKFLHDYVRNGSTCFIVKENQSHEKEYPGKGYYVPNGVDMQLFKEIPRLQSWNVLDIPPKTYLLFCSGRSITRPEKRYDLFKQTKESVKQKTGTQVEELLLVGQKRYLAPHFFNAARVHVLTSDYEGSPNSVKEALACNIPVVSTNVGNVKKMIDTIDGCFVSESHHHDELADLVLKALEYDRINGRDELIRQELDMESVADKIIKIYERAIGEHHLLPLPQAV